MTATIAERVAAGAAFLDEHEPGWVDQIDPDRLDLGSSCRCVVGQLQVHLFRYTINDEPYLRALDRYQVADPFVLGFNAIDLREYDGLTAAWRELILARRGAA